MLIVAGNRYQLTPLHDILSTYPIHGHKPHLSDPHTNRLAMAVEGRNRHYTLREIHRWHWVAAGPRRGAEPIIAKLIERTPTAFDTVAKHLPENFPVALFDSVKAGTMAAIKLLVRQPRQRTGARSAG